MGFRLAGACLAAFLLVPRPAFPQEEVSGRIILVLTDEGARALGRGALADFPIMPGEEGTAPSIRPLFASREGPLARYAVLTFHPRPGEGADANAPWLEAARAWAPVTSAEPDRVFEVAALPDDPYLLGDGGLPRQFQLHNPGGLSLQASRAWPFVPAGREVVVAILDTGVDWRHPDLGGPTPPRRRPLAERDGSAGDPQLR